MKMSDAPQRLVADPEGWKQRYQQHLQQIDAEQEQGRKASAQALEQHKAQQVALVQATKTATAQGKVPTIVQAGELIRQAISDKNGTPISHAYPMSPVFLQLTGSTVEDELQWQAYFTSFDQMPILAFGHGNTVTSVVGSIVNNL